MNKQILTLMLAAGALLASCSNDSGLQECENNGEGMQPMTIRAAIPGEGMHSRAGANGDPEAARCYVQVLDSQGGLLEDDYSVVKAMTSATGGGYETTVYLKEGETYTFLFWADSDSSAQAPDDLKQVDYTNGEVLAWAGRKSASWSDEGVACTLKHVVARITVHTSSAVTLTSDHDFTAEVPTVYGSYNVYSGAPVGTSTTYTYVCDDAEVSANADLGHFYVLVPANGENQNLTLQYNGVLGNPEVTVSNVPLKADYHTTLTGDVYLLGLVGGDITATVSTDWAQSTTETI